MSDTAKRNVIEEIAASVAIPETAYDKAEARYKDLGEWFGRPESTCHRFDPHIYAQGSFRLGTVVRPLRDGDEYDLDLGCRLRVGISKSTHTQKDLKTRVGAELETYRVARGIEKSLEEKHRCWRLQYADQLKFHMDAVPSIPEENQQRQALQAAMVKAGSADVLAQAVASFAGAITDNRLSNYHLISPNWRISNSEGFALWFESQVELAMDFLEKRAIAAKAAQVDKLPARKWGSPLQQSVQILKRHRDVMFADDPDGKPISIILTTLAAQAYRGESDVASASQRILTDMGSCVLKSRPRVPNPVNPAEDFADKWADPKLQHLKLEQNFWYWLEQAKADFDLIRRSRDANFIAQLVQEKFEVSLDVASLKDNLEVGSVQVITSPKSHQIVATPAKPWSRE